MENWREATEQEIVRVGKRLEALKTSGFEVAKLFDDFTIKVPWWGVSSEVFIIEFEKEEDIKKFPPELLGKLLEMMGKFNRTTSRYNGRVEYDGRTKDGIMVSFRIGPLVCKAKKVTEREWIESEDSHYEFHKECDPLFLDEAQREDDLKTDPVSV